MDVCNQLPLLNTGNGNTGIVPPGGTSANNNAAGGNTDQPAPTTKQAGMPWWVWLILIGAGVTALANANSNSPGKK